MKNDNPQHDHVIVVGIGGTGAKCIEAIAHLAASGHTPNNIFPILIDQDKNNGNVERCKNALQSYSILREKTNKSKGWFFKPNIEINDSLLPLLPQEENQYFGAAIGIPSMVDIEQDIVRALFLKSQLNEPLDSGYKKRAHMGSILIEKMLEKEKQKKPAENGLNYIIDKLKNIPYIKVVIIGSLFGGTGASGIVRLSKYFKENMKNANICGVFVTPYYLIGQGLEEDKDANLLKSDTDMQAVKIALQMYKSEIDNSFDNIYIIGSEIGQLGGEYVSKIAKYGGEDQKNPAHIFELIAATVVIESNRIETNKLNSFIADTNLRTPPIEFSLSPKYSKMDNIDNTLLSIKNINPKRLILAKDFAFMLFQCRNNTDKSWWKRQPWADAQHKNDLLMWATRHLDWWNEMSNNVNNHRWGKFSVEINTQIKVYDYSSYLSKFFKGDPAELINLFNTIDRLDNIYIRRLKWASI